MALPQSGKRVVGLYAGWGNFERAARRAGMKVLASYERDRTAVDFHRAGLLVTGEDTPDHVYLADVTQLASIPECDIVVAGIPCQPFSPERAGQQLGMEDERGAPLWEATARLAASGKAKVVVVENVDEAKGPAQSVGAAIFAKYGFRYCQIHVLPASAFGSLQERKRMWATFSVFPMEWDVTEYVTGPRPLSDFLLTVEDFDDDWEAYRAALEPCYVGLGTLRMLIRKQVEETKRGFGLYAVPIDYRGIIGALTKNYWKTGGSAPLLADRCLRCGYQVSRMDSWMYFTVVDGQAGLDKDIGEDGLRYPAHLLCGDCIETLREEGLDFSGHLMPQVRTYLHQRLQAGATSVRRYHPIEGLRMLDMPENLPYPDSLGKAFQLLGNSLHVGTATAVLKAVDRAWPATKGYQMSLWELDPVA